MKLIKGFGLTVLIPLLILSMGTACQKRGADLSDGSGIIKQLATVHFDFDKATIRSDAAGTLQQNASWLSANTKGTVVVEGHCDNRGTNEYNLALGERRAISTKNYYINLGVPGTRINTISYGEERPVNPAENESAWAENRRGETIVKK